MRPRALAALCALLLVVTTIEPLARASASGEREPRGGSPVHRSWTKDQRAKADDGSLLVRLRHGTGAEVLAGRGVERRRTIGRTGFVEVGTRGRPAAEVRDELLKDPRVAAVEPNHIRSAMDAPPSPNDWKWSEQGAMRAAGFPLAWTYQRGAPDVTLAIIDSGVDLDHPDLAAQLESGIDIVDGDAEPQDEAGHGTIVAGIAGAASDNNQGIAGAAYNVRLLPVRVLDEFGQGTDADIAEGIAWAADRGADIINLSLGGPQPSAVLAEAVASAQARGVLVVAAAGNSASATPQYPAALPDVLTVGASHLPSIYEDERISLYSSVGPWVDLATQGRMVSTGLMEGPADWYEWSEGTSMAAALVSAAAALVRQAHPTWDPGQVSRQLITSARDAGPPGHDDAFGFGLLDAAAAVGAPHQGSLPTPAGDASEPNGVPDQATQMGQTAIATIAPETDVDWFAYDLAQPSWVDAVVVPNRGNPPHIDQELDATITVLDPNGRELATMDAAGLGWRNERVVFHGDSAGRYRLRVANANGSVSDGTYTLTVTESSTKPLGFASVTDYLMDATILSTSVADLTGDGRDDVVVTTSWQFAEAWNEYSAFVYPQLPGGGLGTPTRYLVAGRGGYASMLGTTGDVDADGDADVAVATLLGAELFLQEGGKLTGPTIVPFTAPVTQVEVADVDADGDGDLVAMTTAGVEVRLRVQGGWLHPVAITGDVGDELETGDISGDGRADITLTRRECTGPRAEDCVFGMWAYVWRTGVSIDRSAHPTIFVEYRWARGLAIGDLNGDGRNDVAVSVGGNWPSALVNVFYQRADGTLADPDVKRLPHGPDGIEVGDINGDGRTDLVTNNAGSRTLSTLLQQPDGSLADPIQDDTYSISSHLNVKGIAVGELDGQPGQNVALGDNGSALQIFRQPTVPPTGVMPWVVDTAPATHAARVPTTAAPTVTFARNMDQASMTSTTTALVDGSTGDRLPASRSYDAVTRRLTITPLLPLRPASAYQVVVSGVRDQAGGVMETREVVRFRTEPPPPPPPATTTTTTPTTGAPTTTTTAPATTTTMAPPATPTAPRSGYWMLSSAGAVYGFGAAAIKGSAPQQPGQRATNLVVTPSGNGYAVVSNTGRVSTFGDARHLGGSPALLPGEEVTSISIHPSGAGYWLFTSKGRVFPYGSARHFGGLGGVQLNGPVLGSVATPSGNGYYMVASDGGIFAFGDAVFRGSMGGHKLNAPVMGLAPDPDGVGYWLVGTDGGVFAFNSPFRGSMGGRPLNKPVIGIMAYGNGYLMVATDGGIFNFSSKPFAGSLGGRSIPDPIVAVGVLDR